MGLFSSDESETDVPDERVQELVNKAQSDTVTKERLTKTDTSGIVARGINMGDDPLIEYLENDEEPHFIFFSSRSLGPFEISEADAELSTKLSTSAVCITDRRFIVVVVSGTAGVRNPADIEEDIVDVSITTGDVSIEIPFESVVDFETIPADGGPKIDAHKINLRVSDSEIIEKVCLMFDEDYEEFEGTDEIDIVIANAFDKSDIEEVSDYLGTAIEVAKFGDEDTEIQEEIKVGIYYPDKDKNSNLFPREESVVTLGNSSIRFIRDHKREEIQYEDIADIRDYEYTHSLKKERMSKGKGIELILVDGTHIALYNEATNDASGNFFASTRASAPEVDFPENVEERIREKSNISENSIDAKYILDGPFDGQSIYHKIGSASCKMKIEGWTDGSSNISADISASSQEKGQSRGIQVGPFTRSKTASKSSIEGEISGGISDNTYSADVRCLKVYQERLFIDSEIKFDLHYSEIENVFPQKKGVVIEVGSMTLRIEKVSNSDEIGEAVSFVQDQMDTFAEEEPTTDDEGESTDSADKLRELKELHEDGILTDEEFQSKKEELLDDF